MASLPSMKDESKGLAPTIPTPTSIPGHTHTRLYNKPLEDGRNFQKLVDPACFTWTGPSIAPVDERVRPGAFLRDSTPNSHLFGYFLVAVFTLLSIRRRNGRLEAAD